MNKKLNWKLKNLINQNKPFVLVATLCFVIFLFVQATPVQNDTIVCKTKSIMVDGSWKAFTSLQAVGSSFPCGEEMAIAVEDLGRYIFSAQSGWLATLLPNGDVHTIPPEGWGGSKLEDAKSMTYQNAYNRIENMSIGTFDGTYGKRWAVSAEQAAELYHQVHTVNIGGEELATIDHSNMFYDGLIATQVLIKNSEEQAAIIESQQNDIKQLTERLDNLESALNNASQFTPNKTMGKVSINPNPNTNGVLNITYDLYEQTSNDQLVLTDIQGKVLYQIKLANTSGKEKIDINLAPGNYLYFLRNSIHQTVAQKITIQ